MPDSSKSGPASLMKEMHQATGSPSKAAKKHFSQKTSVQRLTSDLEQSEFMQIQQIRPNDAISGHVSRNKIKID